MGVKYNGGYIPVAYKLGYMPNPVLRPFSVIHCSNVFTNISIVLKSNILHNSGMNKHRTTKTTIKRVPIDNKITLIVNWLNSFGGIYTRHSCQGVYDKDGKDKNRQCAYVLFYCDDLLDLLSVCNKAGNLATIEVDMYQGSLRYKIIFHYKNDLDTMKDNIKNFYWREPTTRK